MAQRSPQEEEILQEVKTLKDLYFTFDIPVPFKNLTLTPVKTKDYFAFMSASQCLTLNKNDDPKGITLTHLDYLIHRMSASEEEGGPVMSQSFQIILKLCANIDNGFLCSECGKYLSYSEYASKVNEAVETLKAHPETATEEKFKELIQCDCEKHGEFKPVLRYEKDEKAKHNLLFIRGEPYDFRDFNRLRKYILYQNLPDYKDDSFVDKAIRDDQAAKAELQARGQGTASFEDKILAVMLFTNQTLEQIYEMPLRKFLKVFAMANELLEYKILKQGLQSGFVSLPKGKTLDHWLYKKDEGLYGKAVDADAYASQIRNNN